MTLSPLKFSFIVRISNKYCATHVFEGSNLYMSRKPNMNIIDVKDYVEKYLEKMYLEPLKITIDKMEYVVNDILRFKIYDFWNKTDEELLNDFENYSFKEDYIGTIFFFLSGYWEYIHNNIKDEYGRFPSSESFSCKKGILEEPVVDILVERIREELGFTYKDNKSKAFVTHDIDHLWLPTGLGFWRSLGIDIVKRKDLKLACDRIKKSFTKDNPWPVYNLIEMHKKDGTKGTFFFMPRKQPKVSWAGYDVIENKEYLQNLGNEIKSINGRIGIHYDIDYLKENRMKDDIDRLSSIFDTKIEYGRAHYLVFDITRSFDIYEKAGIKFDSTCSFSDAVGFRFGTSKPFRPYNFVENREYNVVEIPLIVMDDSLQSSRYVNLTLDEKLEKIKQIIDKVGKYNGTFTFLWHNSSFYVTEWRGWKWLYDEAIKYLKENNFEFI